MIAPDRLEAIRIHDETVRCLEQAYRYLARRPHLESELRIKLNQKGFASQRIEDTFNELKKKRYLDDAEFIRLSIRDQSRLKKSGPLLIRKNLITKGAGIETVSQILEEEYPQSLMEENACELALKKTHQLRDSVLKARIQKTVRFLQQRGYGWELIQYALEKTGINHEDDQE